MFEVPKNWGQVWGLLDPLETRLPTCYDAEYMVALDKTI